VAREINVNEASRHEVSTGSGSDRVDLAVDTPLNLSKITRSLSLEFRYQCRWCRPTLAASPPVCNLNLFNRGYAPMIGRAQPFVNSSPAGRPQAFRTSSGKAARYSTASGSDRILRSAWISKSESCLFAS